MMYAIIVTVVGLGAGISACVVKRWFDSCGEEISDYEVVVRGEGRATKFHGGYNSRESAIREAVRSENACRRNGMNKSAVHLGHCGSKR